MFYSSTLLSIISVFVSIAIGLILPPLIVKEAGIVTYGLFALTNQMIVLCTVYLSSVNSLLPSLLVKSSIKTIELKNTGSIAFKTNVVLSVIACTIFVVLNEDIVDLFFMEYKEYSGIDYLLRVGLGVACLSIFYGYFLSFSYLKNQGFYRYYSEISRSVVKLIFVLIVIVFGVRISIEILSILILVSFLLPLLIAIRPFANSGFNPIKYGLRMKPGSYYGYIKNGVLNSISSYSITLLTGMNIVFSSLFFTPEVTGIVALSQVFPSLVNGLISSVSSVFASRVFRASKLLGKPKSFEVVYLSCLLKLTIITIPVLSYIFANIEPLFSLWLGEYSYFSVFLSRGFLLVGVAVSSTWLLSYLNQATGFYKVFSLYSFTFTITILGVLFLVRSLIDLDEYRFYGILILSQFILYFMFLPLSLIKAIDIKMVYKSIFAVFSLFMFLAFVFYMVRLFVDFINVPIFLNLLINSLCAIFIYILLTYLYFIAYMRNNKNYSYKIFVKGMLDV